MDGLDILWIVHAYKILSCGLEFSEVCSPFKLCAPATKWMWSVIDFLNAIFTNHLNCVDNIKKMWDMINIMHNVVYDNMPTSNSSQIFGFQVWFFNKVIWK